MLALAPEPNIMVNNIGMSWQHVCLPLKSYIVDVDDQAIAWRRCRVMLTMVLLSPAGNDAVEATWPQCDVDVESCWRQCC
jgi:hypothetical protein